MRKLLAVSIIAVLAFTALNTEVTPEGATPAQAQHFGEKCRHHEGPDGSGGVSGDVCAVVNGRDTNLWSDIEGMCKWSHGAFSDPMDIQFDYVRLWRINLDDSRVIVEAKESLATFSNDVTGNYSTDWYDLITRPDHRWFYGACRYRVKWPTKNNEWGAWYGLTSFQTFQQA